MTSYVVVFVEQITDPAAMLEYRELALKSIEGTNAKLLVGRGLCETVEGDPVTGVGIVAFPTYEEAKAWYYSDGYKAATQKRLEGSICRGALVQGVDEI